MELKEKNLTVRNHPTKTEVRLQIRTYNNTKENVDLNESEAERLMLFLKDWIDERTPKSHKKEKREPYYEIL